MRVPDAHTRLCNGTLAHRVLLELIGTKNLVWPVTYPKKIEKVRGIIKTYSTVVIMYIYLKTEKQRILKANIYQKVHFHLQTVPISGDSETAGYGKYVMSEFSVHSFSRGLRDSSEQFGVLSDRSVLL